MDQGAESDGFVHLTEEEERALLLRHAAALAADPEFQAKNREIRRQIEAGELFATASKDGGHDRGRAALGD
jgi:hypothetical protein